MCSVKWVFLKISKNSPENTCGRVPQTCNFITKKTCESFKIIQFLNIIESLLKTNDSSILISVLLRKDHIKSENIFYSDIFKYERELTKHDLIPKYELLQRSFIHGNFQTIFPADTSLHCLRIKLPLHLLEIVQRQWRGSIKKRCQASGLQLY